jgi:glutamate formiminotransferase
MPRRIVECVPNFSEGRNADTVQEIAETIRQVPGVLLLGQEQDADHHRSVITYIGSPEAVCEAAVRAAIVAAERIDLRQHQGVHPRIGALDVLPFIPVENITLAECAELARRAARLIWERCGIPCYLYEAAALRGDRRNLADVRRGGFEGLSRDVSTDPSRQPDVGGPSLHPTAGATAVGARKFLIAWNVLLSCEDPTTAREIASLVRQSSGGFPYVKALGLPLPNRGISQVSMNLLDFEETPMQPVFDVIQREAQRRGVEVVGTEIIGFLPRKALELNVRASLRIVNFRPDIVLENRIEELANSRQALSEPTALKSGIGYYRESLELLYRVSTWASVSPAGESFDWARTAYEIRRELDALDENSTTSRTLIGDCTDKLETAIIHAERCADIKTRLAAERVRLVPSSEGEVEPKAFDAIWHMLEASFHFALLAIQELSPSDSIAEGRSAVDTTRDDNKANRIRALQALVTPRPQR